jgi:biotin carboxyl carrier protein
VSSKGDTLKISGKGFLLSDTAGEGWKFESRPGGWIIATNASGKRIRLSAIEFRGKFSFALVDQGQSQSGWGEIVAKSHAAGAAAAQASVDADLTAQFPGKVRKILVAAGARVAAGDALVLVEAMKMEFAVKAPVPGQVTGIRVKEGQQLSPGDRLIDFEAEEGGNGNK